VAGVTLISLAFIVMPPVLGAQRTEVATPSDWRLSWSPLVLTADLSQIGPAPSRFASILLHDTPRVGLLWPSGNVAGLPLGEVIALDERSPGRAHFRASGDSKSGEYARTTEPLRSRRALLRTEAWREFPGETDGEQSSSVPGPGDANATVLSGALNLSQSWNDGSTNALRQGGPSASPFVSFDSAAPSITARRATLEGAFAARRRAWLGGIALGIETGEGVASRSPRSRTTVGSAPGAAVGLGRIFLRDRLVVGAQARWVGRVESIDVGSNPGLTTLHDFSSLDDARKFEVTPLAPYYRRIVRDGRAYQAVMAGRAKRINWSLAGESSAMSEQVIRRRANSPPRDGWTVRARSVTLAAESELPKLGRSALVVSALDADGLVSRSDLTGVLLAQERSELRVATHVRRTPRSSSRWDWFGAAQFDAVDDKRVDGLAGLVASTAAISISGWSEIARSFGSGTVIAIGTGGSTYTPRSVIPAGESLAAAAGRYLTPTQEYESAGALVTHGTLLVRHSLRDRSTLWVGLAGSRIAPWRNGEQSAFAPTGTRRDLTFSMGATLR